MQLIVDLFAPVAQIESTEGKNAKLLWRAGALPCRDPAIAFVKPGMLLTPVLRYLNRDGSSRRVEAIDWTYLIVPPEDKAAGEQGDDLYRRAGGEGANAAWDEASCWSGADIEEIRSLMFVRAPTRKSRWLATTFMFTVRECPGEIRSSAHRSAGTSDHRAGQGGCAAIGGEAWSRIARPAAGGARPDAASDAASDDDQRRG